MPPSKIMRGALLGIAGFAMRVMSTAVTVVDRMAENTVTNVSVAMALVVVAMALVVTAIVLVVVAMVLVVMTMVLPLEMQGAAWLLKQPFWGRRRRRRKK